jgi:hypothetical protein
MVNVWPHLRIIEESSSLVSLLIVIQCFWRRTTEGFFSTGDFILGAAGKHYNFVFSTISYRSILSFSIPKLDKPAPSARTPSDFTVLLR